MTDLENELSMTFDNEIQGRINVSRNHIVLNTMLSTIIFVVLCLPYFFPWFSEQSSVTGYDLFFTINRVWVPQTLKDNNTTFVDYQFLSLADF
jgi:hypothetical protein